MARYTHSFCVLVLVAVGIACVAGEVQREAVGEHRRAGTAPVVVRSDDLSVPALVITFRECVEGCVIVSVLLNMLHKAGMHESKKWVWIGTTIALLLTIFFGSICIIVWYTIQRNMPNDGRAAFEGALATVACSVLSLMGFKFLRLKDIIVKWEGKLFKKGEAAEGEGEGEGVEKPKMSLWQQFRDMLHIKHQAIGDQAEVSGRAIILLTISAIFREGLETVIFLLPMSTNSSEIGLVKGAFAGGAAGFAFGLLVLVVGKYALTNVMWFFNLTTAFIFFIAGGLANYALIEFEQIDTPSIKSRNDPWLLRPVYNIGCQPRHPEVPVRCFLDETTGAGLAFRSLLGYRAAPSLLQCLAYLFYFQTIILVIVWRYKKGVLFTRFAPGTRPESPSPILAARASEPPPIEHTLEEGLGAGYKPGFIPMTSMPVGSHQGGGVGVGGGVTVWGAHVPREGAIVVGEGAAMAGLVPESSSRSQQHTAHPAQGVVMGYA